jgi:glycosyltransferase involved in cell wall biosynthesis
MDSPLVSVITPTADRRQFWPQCLACFLSQDYPNLEWVIYDDGESIKDLLPLDSRIKYYHDPLRKNHGQKMNRCMELAQGEYAIVWDDDDWYAPNRITRQIEPMTADPQIQVTGTSQLLYVLHGSQRVFHYKNMTNLAWIGAIAFRKSAWQTHRFHEKPHGADFDFLQQIPKNQWFDLADTSLMLSTIHQSNAAPKRIPAPWWVEQPWAVAQKIKGGL